MTSEEVVLSADRVTAGYGGGARARDVLHDVSLDVVAGSSLGVVGESGSGKSTLARVLVGQLAARRGTVQLDGRDIGGGSRAHRFQASRKVQLVPQDPYSSLDPRMPVERVLAEAIDPRGRLRVRAHRDRINELLASVALDPSAAGRLPHEFSGGQRQRIVIARALAVDPRVIIADEVTSSLDSSVQAEILTLLLDLQKKLRLTYVFITHDLAVARYMCAKLSVLYLGTVVEQGGSDILSNPDHPYSELLKNSVPDPTGVSVLQETRTVGDEDAADPAHPPTGCVFHPRCPYGSRVRDDRPNCSSERPVLVEHLPGRSTACHYPIGRLADAVGDLR